MKPPVSGKVAAQVLRDPRILSVALFCFVLTRTAGRAQLQDKSVDKAMAERKREREKDSSDGVNKGSAGTSKRGRGAAAGKLDFVECTICGKACPSPSKLTEHMRTHTGDRPYDCTTCDIAAWPSRSLAA